MGHGGDSDSSQEPVFSSSSSSGSRSTISSARSHVRSQVQQQQQQQQQQQPQQQQQQQQPSQAQTQQSQQQPGRKAAAVAAPKVQDPRSVVAQFYDVRRDSNGGGTVRCVWRVSPKATAKKTHLLERPYPTNQGWTSFKVHLQKFHPEVYAALERALADNKPELHLAAVKNWRADSPPSRAPASTIDAYATRVGPLTHNEEAKFHWLCWMAEKNVSHNAMESSHLTKFFQLVGAGGVPFHKDTVTYRFTLLAAAAQRVIRQVASESPVVHASFDGWTDTRLRAFIVLLLQGLIREHGGWARFNLVLDLIDVDKEGSGEQIARSVAPYLLSLSDDCRLGTIGTDGASRMANARQYLLQCLDDVPQLNDVELQQALQFAPVPDRDDLPELYKGTWDYAHQMNLAVSDVLYKDGTKLAAVATRANAFAQAVNRSIEIRQFARDQLRAFGLRFQELRGESATRWNWAFYLVEKLVVGREAYHQVARQMDWTDAPESLAVGRVGDVDYDVQNKRAYHALLAVQDLFLFMQARDSQLAELPLQYLSLVNRLNALDTDVAKELSDAVQARLKFLVTDVNAALAQAALTPRFADLSFIETRLVRRVWRGLERVFIDYHPVAGEPIVEEDADDVQEDAATFVMKKVTTAEQRKEEASKSLSENLDGLRRHLLFLKRQIDLGEREIQSCLEFWGTVGSELSDFQHGALVVASMGLGSVDAEAAVSVAELVQSGRRAGLLKNHVRDRTLLACFLQQVEAPILMEKLKQEYGKLLKEKRKELEKYSTTDFFNLP